MRCDALRRVWWTGVTNNLGGDKDGEWGKEYRSRGATEAQCGRVWWTGLAVGGLGRPTVAVGAGRKKRERAVEEEAEEKGRPGTVNTPTDALRNVSCRATQGREGQERGEEGEE